VRYFSGNGAVRAIEAGTAVLDSGGLPHVGAWRRELGGVLALGLATGPDAGFGRFDALHLYARLRRETYVVETRALRCADGNPGIDVRFTSARSAASFVEARHPRHARASQVRVLPKDACVVRMIWAQFDHISSIE
jgi:hypothetical protein